MKNIIIILGFALASTESQAQKVQIALSGGIAGITNPSQAIFKGSDNKSSFVGQLATSYRFTPKVTAGLSVASLTMARHGKVEWMDINLQSTGARDGDIYIGKAVMAGAFASYHIGNLYAGPQLGVVISKGEDDDKYEAPQTFTLYYANATGFSAGLHVGYSFPLSKHFGLFAEARGNYITMEAERNKYSVPIRGKKYGRETHDLNFLQTQLTAGLQLNL